MKEKLQFLGTITLTQLQPEGLIIQKSEEYFYDHTRLMRADQLKITPSGIEAVGPDGRRILDIHHLDHPGKAYDKEDLVCIGFSSHYAAMRARFGEHMQDGLAGENIIVDTEEEIWPEQLGEQIAIENKETGSLAYLRVTRYARPCGEFSHFAANSQDKRLPAKELKDTLQFLDHGRRGYLLVAGKDQGPFTVQPGDRVYRVN